MPDRFHTPQPLDVPRVTLEGAEAHHMLHVLRLKPGDRVLLFDGRGTEADAEIASIDRQAAELSILETRKSASGPRREIVLAAAVPKGDRFRWLVEKATELGVSRFVPLVCEHSVVRPGAGKLEKLRQTVIAACKQSGRNDLMDLSTRLPFADFLEQFSATGPLLLAHPTGEPLRETAGKIDDQRPLILTVGPEGGFTDLELQLAVTAGARLVSLGPRILRIETAALAFAAWFTLPRGS